MTRAQMAAAVAERTQDACSADRYGPKQWLRLCQHLARLGWNELQIEAVVRSKWTRWAADRAGADYGKATAAQFATWLVESGLHAPLRGPTLEDEVEQLVVETFPALDTMARDIMRGVPNSHARRDARRFLRTLPVESEQRRVWVRVQQLAERERTYS